MAERRVAIIGAGIGGLAAAAILSRHCRVTVFEKEEQAGGKIRQEKLGNIAIDSGPTVFTMPWILEEIFAEAGGDFSNAPARRKLETLARHSWKSDGRLDLYADRNRTADAIARFASPADGRAYLAFCKSAAKIYQTLESPFLKANSPSLINLILKRDPFALMTLDPYSTLWQTLSRQFRDVRLRQLFARYSTYCGSSPFAAPATLMLIAHVEQEGVWLLEGGMQALVAALEEVARRNGAEFHFKANVSSIESHAGRVSGVLLENEDLVECDTVIANADIGALVSGLFGENAASALDRLAGVGTRSQSAITWSMNAVAQGFDLDVHNVFFSSDYKSEFDDVFVRTRTPQEPTVYVFAPDRTGVVAGKERLFALVNAPPLQDGRAMSNEEITACHQRTFEHLRLHGLVLETSTAETKMTTPNDFARRFPGSAGALFGQANHGWRASFQRRGASTNLKGLYLAGGSIHPGPGVPMAALSGRNAARAVLKSFAST